MTHGLRITNPSGQLVFATDGTGHTYRGQPTLQTAQSWNGIQLLPYEFRWTAPDATHRPIVGVTANGSTVVTVEYMERLSAGSATWRIYVYSVSTGSRLFGAAQGGPVGVQPTVHIWYPGAGSQAYGLRLYRTDGSTALDLSTPPLYVREFLSYPARSYSLVSGVVSGDVAAWNGDSQSITTGMTAPVVLGTTGGYGETFFNSNGELDLHFAYGWTVSGATLRRDRLVTEEERPSTVGESARAFASAIRCGLIDPSTLV